MRLSHSFTSPSFVLFNQLREITLLSPSFADCRQRRAFDCFADKVDFSCNLGHSHRQHLISGENKLGHWVFCFTIITLLLLLPPFLYLSVSSKDASPLTMNFNPTKRRQLFKFPFFPRISSGDC